MNTISSGDNVEKPASSGKNNQRLKTVLMAAVGVLFIFCCFFLVTKSPLVKFLRPQANPKEIHSAAESFIKELPIDHAQLERDAAIKLDNDLLAYAQYFRKENGRFPDLAVGFWDIRWNDPQRSRQDGHQTPLASVRYDFSGSLVGFAIREDVVQGKNGQQKKSTSLSEDDAYTEATYFLATQNIDIGSLVIANTYLSKKGDYTSYKFVIKNNIRQYPDLLEQYTVEVLGSEVASFQLERIIDTRVSGDLSEDNSWGIALILLIVTWVTICAIIVVQFVRRLRRDELEFKRALFIAAAVGAMVAVVVFLKESGYLTGYLVGAGVAGLLAAVAVLIVFPVAEAQYRQVWPEKLLVTDLLFQGKAWLQEFGAAILKSFFFVGVTLLLFALLILASSSFNIGQLSFEHSKAAVLQDFTSSTSAALGGLLLALASGLIILCFWPAYLKERLSKRAILFVALVLSFNLAGLHTAFFRPTYLSFIMVLPIALLWAVIIYRVDLLTALLSLWGVFFFLDLVLVVLMPECLFSLPGTIALISLALILILGLYLLFCPRSAEDYDSYVPTYVTRIAEKERFLKELEIARSVQMRFLPQTVPESPNLEIVSLCRPAMEVGGDYYDFIQLDERYMSILVGDVSGKGVSAAFYMTMIKGIIKTLARKTKDPAQLLAEANEIFYENAPRDTFITAIYGIFDLEEKTLTIASAGHNPLIAWKEKLGRTELYNPRGIALGFNRGGMYQTAIQEEVIPIDEGDIFVFYTDGVSEAMNMNQDIFGQQRLRDIVEKFSHLPPRKLEEKIIQSVNDFSGAAPQQDDFTMVIVKMKPNTMP